MSRFIPCGRGAPYDGPWRVGDQCKLCWLYFNDGKEDVAAGFHAHYDQFPPPGHGGVRPPEGSTGTVVQSVSFVARPGFVQKAVNWIEDTVKWKKAGKPKVTDEEAAARHTICKSNVCQAYEAEMDTCLACGCPLHKTVFGHKLKRATSECPLGYWEAK